MRHPSSDNRAAQFMFASPRSAKHVRTSSCAKALARMSYTRGLASFFIVATPASNCLLNREHITADGETPSRAGTTHLVMSLLEFRWRRTVLVPQSHPPVNEPVLIGASALERAVRLPGRTPASAHRFLHERADPCFFGAVAGYASFWNVSNDSLQRLQKLDDALILHVGLVLVIMHHTIRHFTLSLHVQFSKLRI